MKVAPDHVSFSEVLEKAKVDGVPLILEGLWIRNEKGKLESAAFDFLLAKDGKPLHVSAELEDGEWKVKVEDVSKELGDVGEAEALLKKVKLAGEKEIIARIEAELEKMKKRGYRLFKLGFYAFDDEFDFPVWRAELKMLRKPNTIFMNFNALTAELVSMQEVK